MPFRYTFDQIPDDLPAAAREALGEDAAGLTDRQCLLAWLRRQAEPLVVGYRLRRRVAPAMAAEEAARVVAEQALATERQARLTAEAQVRSQAAADVGGIA